MENPQAGPDDGWYKTLTHNALHVAWHFAVGLVLVPGVHLYRHPDYPVFVRFFACMSFLLWAIAAHEEGRKRWRNALLVTLVALNPWFPLQLQDRDSRTFVLWAAVAVAACSLYGIYRPFPTATRVRAEDGAPRGEAGIRDPY